MDIGRRLSSLLLLMGICCASSENDYSEEQWKTRYAPRRCQQPPRIVGTSKTFQMRWFYNESSARCENLHTDEKYDKGNNFESKEACNTICRDEHYGVCGGAKNDSLCKPTAEYRFWFDPDNRTCKRFKYGGCDPNSNTFRTRLECLRECAEFIENRCALPIDEGGCMGSETRFGYNPVFRSCEEFKYSGCEGNRNNFKTAKECWTTCANDSRCLKHTQENTGWYRPYESYYYNVEKNECRRTKTFLRKSLAHKYNRFRNTEECERVCKRKHTPTTRSPYMK